MRRTTILLAAVAFFIAACGGSSDAPFSGTDDGDTPDFTGEWALTGGTVDGAPFPLVADHRVTMFLRDGQIGGTAACNGYGGSYTLEGSTIRIMEWAITEMACEPHIMAAEAVFVQVLQRDSLILTRDGGALRVDGDGVALDFELIPPVAQADLVGTTWHLHTLIEGQAATQFTGEATLRLLDDGTFTTSTGCRELTGTYQLSGDELLVMSMQAIGECPQDLAGVDSHVISVFESARIEVDGDQLRLISGSDGLQYAADR